MRQWMISGALVTSAAVMAACGEPRSTPVGPRPEASVAALTTLPVCDLSGTNPLVTHYFNNDDAKIVRGLLTAITTAGAGTVTARDRGFDVIALVAANAQAGTGGDAASASDLINAVTACMFTDLAEFPASYPEDYTVAIATALAGGLGVRGGVF